MGYTLGLDLGTTSSAAAVNDGAAVRMLSVDHSAAVIPSVVHLDADGTFLVGAAAERKAISDPGGIAREFKRRFGDPQPLILSGTPVAANDLMLQVATALVDVATRQLGEAPEKIIVCHPANWGSYKLGLLSDTLNNSSLPPHQLISEPEAAAIHYASQERVGDGEVIAIYDLGGGTFDAVVLRKTTDAASGWEILGEPRGIERLGGIDFDLAVLTHVIGVLDLDLDQFDSEDASNQAAMTRFRAECREAKHALSADVSATIPVLLPGYNETVRITRREFEALIDPAIGRTIDTLDIAVATTGLEMDAIDRILLVGGSTRVPLVAARLAEATNRPIKSDAHPKHAMALGAASSADAAATTISDETASGADAPANDAAATAKASLSHTDLYALPHIDEEPLPEFMQGRDTATRGAPSPTPPAAPAAPSSPAAPTPPTAPAPPAAPMQSPGSIPAPAAPTPAPAPPPAPVAPQADTTPPAAAAPPVNPAPPVTAETPAVGPVLIDERVERSGGRSGIVVFLASFAVVGAVLAAILFGLVGTGSDSSTDTEAGGVSETTEGEATDTTDPTETTEAPDPTVPEGSNCSLDQLADPDVTYRVSDTPDDFLNARNVPSTTEVDGVTSRPVTILAEFTELDLDTTRCSVAENGRVWWGFDYDGPDEDGGTYTGPVWVSTRFIEPVPG